jgi:DNA polymerase-3 subunit gamma/tau
MAYQVLARKWRPRTFADVVGQDHVTRTLANAIERGRIPQAVLFTGSRGVGKTSAARILAAALCCDQGPTPEPCGACEPCRQIAAGRALDVIEVDAASNNTVDDVRELRESVRYQPAQFRRKVYILDEVHMLSGAAFNAFLKTLEEPPPHVTFVFATTEVHKLPITILSRCQRFDFKLVPTPQLAAHLGHILRREALPFEPAALSLIAREAGGSVRDSLSLLDQVINFVQGEAITAEKVADALGVADRSVLLALAESVLRREPGEVLHVAERALSRGFGLPSLSRSFLDYLRDLIVFKTAREPQQLLDCPVEELEPLRPLLDPVPVGLLLQLFDRWTLAVDEVARAAVPIPVFEIALVELCLAEPVRPLAELIERFDRLAAGDPGGPGPSSSGRGSGGPQRMPSVRAPAPAPAPEHRPAAAAERSDGSPLRQAGPMAPAQAPPLASASGNGPDGEIAESAAPPPAAPSAPAPPAAGRPDAFLPSLQEWGAVVGALSSKKPGLAALLEHARLGGWNDRGLELIYPEEQAALAEQLRERDTLAPLLEALRQQVGRPVVVAIRVDATQDRRGAAPSAQPGAPSQRVPAAGEPTFRPSPALGAAESSLIEAQEAERRREQQRREEEARSHPLVKTALDTFRATIAEIKTEVA